MCNSVTYARCYYEDMYLSMVTRAQELEKQLTESLKREVVLRDKYEPKPKFKIGDWVTIHEEPHAAYRITNVKQQDGFCYQLKAAHHNWWKVECLLTRVVDF